MKLFPADDFTALMKSFSNKEFSTDLEYLDIESLNQTKISKTSLGIIHLNISSLANHINDLKLLLQLSKHRFDVICISESRIHKDKDPSVNINLPGYTIEHTSTESKAGGTLLYISNDINYKLRNDLIIYKSKELESIFVELIFEKKKNIIVGCIYRHPLMAPNDFIDNYFESLLNNITNIEKPIF